MKIIHNRDFKTLVEETDKKLNEIGFSTDEGSISKLFADIINKNISNFYESLEVNHSEAFIGSASGDSLNNIGTLLNCTRMINESDDSYRRRIQNQVLYLTAANETSIKIACLSIDGVSDIAMKKFSNGPGSFTVIPLCKNYDDGVIGTVEKVLSNVASFGEKIIVRRPKEKFIKMKITLILSTILNDSERNELRAFVSREITNYINSIKIGDTLIINELTKRIMSVSEKITSYSCINFKINNKECLFINQGSMWDEKFRVSSDKDSLIIE